jgi:hypothetical protein
VTTVGSRVAKKVDENRNDENAGTADAYAAERERLDEEEVI